MFIFSTLQSRRPSTALIHQWKAMWAGSCPTQTPSPLDLSPARLQATPLNLGRDKFVCKIYKIYLQIYFDCTESRVRFWLFCYGLPCSMLDDPLPCVAHVHDSLQCIYPCSPSGGMESSSPMAHSFPNFQHPSHSLLKANGFQQQQYYKYRRNCLRGKTLTVSI